MKTAAVLGASSMLGQALCKQLNGQGVEIIRIGRDDNADIKFDLADDKFNLSHVRHRADVFFHCAASFADDSEQGVAHNLRINAYSAATVARIAVQLGARQFVYAGTLSSATDFDSGRYSSYGLSKALAEQQLLWLLDKFGGQCCVLRFTHLYDTLGCCIQHQPWLGRIVVYAANGQTLNLPEALAIRNFLHVDDAAKMMLKAVAMKAAGVLNALNPQSLTMMAITQMAYQIFNNGGQYLVDASKGPFRALNYPKGEGCWNTLNYIPTITLEQTFSQIKQQGLSEQFGPMDVA
ncbi:MAG: NAD(P)-dependent oxidoreductase [Gammaproteobacteria bacterium]|nr:NAD(P)-dependent oxidoreductase [Gammaproteobacteria bacterium]MBU2181066.1 NAD(P)-dependent oxidoreductase [Gammaproteobacteria bacterium]MBU2225796.1 NAD(P)-dependent oxidoreductase [Gammaproteobacteria bacterium]